MTDTKLSGPTKQQHSKPVIALAQTIERYVVNIPDFQIEIFHYHEFPHSPDATQSFSIEVQPASGVPMQPLQFRIDRHEFKPEVPVNPSNPSEQSSETPSIRDNFYRVANQVFEIDFAKSISYETLNRILDYIEAEKKAKESR
jgi:hypothetical protein